MPTPEEFMMALADKSEHLKMGKTFGNPCLKLVDSGKVPAMAKPEALVIKLPQKTIEAWLEKEGVALFVPMTGKTMKEWLVVPQAYAAHWEDLIGEAAVYVAPNP